MKAKMTRGQIKKYYNNILSIGYCDLYYLLKGLDPIGYASGVYGWNYDVYFTGHNVTICTGYRSTPGKTVDYDIVHGYNSRAEKIFKDYGRGYEERMMALDDLLKEFCEYCEANIF